MSFAETRLELGIDYGTRGSLRFNTGVLVDGSGAEQRNALTGSPLGKWQIGDRTLTYDELNYFLDFHAARKGSFEGFRFKDWADYQAFNQPLGTGDGTKTQFQLIKTYTVGGLSVKRPILKPVANTVKIYSNSNQLDSGWTVDNTLGVVTFTTPPNNGAIITADFEFDVPVRFEQDHLDFRFDAIDPGSNRAIFQLQNLSLVELRYQPTIKIAPSQLPVSIKTVLDLGYDYGTVGGPAYNTTINAVGAGYEKRTSNWSESRGKWQIGDRTLTRAELDYFIAFYRVVRGSAVGFKYKDWASVETKNCRFENDSIEFRFDAIDLISNQAIFYLSGIDCIETIDLDSVTYNNLVVTTSIARTNSCYPTYDCVNGACVPVAGDRGRYKTLADCQAALIPPPFTGGQCETMYDVVIHYTEACNTGYNCSTLSNIRSGALSKRVMGSIEAVYWKFSSDPNNRSAGIWIRHHNGTETPAGFGCSGGICMNQSLYTVNLVTVTRADGGADDCGNLASTCPS